jgi:hypothetical protein
MSASDANADETGEFPESSVLEQKRPALTAALEHGPSEPERETMPPADSRHFPDRDETAGLVSLLFHAQQAVQSAFRFIDEARDANDEELALFLEAAQREGMTRVDQAKSLLATRLQERDGAAATKIHEAQRGRVHYVSVPDEPPAATVPLSGTR